MGNCLILGSKIVVWSGRRSIRWPRWTLFPITCRHTVIPTPNSTFIPLSSLISPHRTRGTVFRMLVRDSISFIKNNIKDTRIIRIVRQMLCLAAIVAILKSILRSSDLKTTLIALATMWWKQLMSKVELNCMPQEFKLIRGCFELACDWFVGSSHADFKCVVCNLVWWCFEWYTLIKMIEYNVRKWSVYMWSSLWSFNCNRGTNFVSTTVISIQKTRTLWFNTYSLIHWSIGTFTRNVVSIFSFAVVRYHIKLSRLFRMTSQSFALFTFCDGKSRLFQPSKFWMKTSGRWRANCYNKKFKLKKSVKVS